MARKDEIKLKPRKHPELWQKYKSWHEWSEWRKRHTLRISAIDRGASSYSRNWEESVLESTDADGWLKYFEKVLHEEAQTLGPVYDWLCSIHGIGPQLAAKILALIDDIEESPTISALWRFAGYAVINGERERPVRGEKLHYSKALKSAVWQVSDSFVKCNSPLYRDYYDTVKAEYQARYPEPECTKCHAVVSECASPEAHEKARRYTRGHIDAMARRKLSKLFLSHLWLRWREFDGLPISEPYAFGPGGHSPQHIIPPP